MYRTGSVLRSLLVLLASQACAGTNTEEMDTAAVVAPSVSATPCSPGRSAMLASSSTNGSSGASTASPTTDTPDPGKSSPGEAQSAPEATQSAPAAGGTPAPDSDTAEASCPPLPVDQEPPTLPTQGSLPSASSSATPSAASSAAGGAPGAVADPPTTDDGFTLLFRDDFDSLDLTRWQLMTHSWDSNIALFSEESVSVESGQLFLRLLSAPEGTTDDQGNAKAFLGAEVRSLDTLTYGRVVARAKLAAGSAVISSLVTIYTPWPADNWNELDIEFLGLSPAQIQFNTMVYTGAPTTPPVTESVSPTQDPFEQPLGFDPSADFHLYAIEWTPSAASFSIDGQILYTWTENIALMTLAQNVLLTIWASSAEDWAGPVTDATSSAVAVYDWIELYQWQ